MATSCALFEVEILGHPSADRGLEGGANYKLVDAYRRGIVDPLAHQLAKVNPRQTDALTRNSKMTSFDAITGP